LVFNGLHAVISQEIELFITTAMGTSNPPLGIYVLSPEQENVFFLPFKRTA
jgi:hypothetical protein